MLREDQKQRYRRQIMLPEIGEAGQNCLLESRVLLAGAGALGSAAGLYLAGAGVGTLGIADDDTVELSNLHRQVAHETSRVGQLKTASLAARLGALNPDVQTVRHNCRLTRANAAAIVRDYNFVVDATDTFESKYLVADACHDANVPYSHAGVMECCAQTITVIPGRTPCLRCLFPKQPGPEDAPASTNLGLLGTVPGIIGTVQATEAIKFLLDIGQLLTGRLMALDAATMRIDCIPVSRDSTCPLCGGTAGSAAQP